MPLTQIIAHILYQDVCAYGQEMSISRIVAQLLQATFTDHSPYLYQEVCAYGQEMSISRIVAQLLQATFTDHSPYFVSRGTYIWPGNVTIKYRSTAIACLLNRS